MATATAVMITPGMARKRDSAPGAAELADVEPITALEYESGQEDRQDHVGWHAHVQARSDYHAR